MTRRPVALALVTFASAAVAGCDVIAGIEEFALVGTDGGALSATWAEDATVDAAAPADCAGFTCGRACVGAGDPSFGCHVDNSCRPCPAPAHARATCAGTTCARECVDAFLDCNGSPDDGCEVDPREDSRNCAGCGKACADPTPVCVAGTCVSTCPPTLTACNGNCVDFNTSPTNCGACGHACEGGLANASRTCTNGTCGIQCSVGWANCNGADADGCETFVAGNDVNRCGSCNACSPLPGAISTCASGQCGIACAGGRADCNNSAQDGCECDLSVGYCSGATCAPCKNTYQACTSTSECCRVSGSTSCAPSRGGSICTP